MKILLEIDPIERDDELTIASHRENLIQPMLHDLVSNIKALGVQWLKFQVRAVVTEAGVPRHYTAEPRHNGVHVRLEPLGSTPPGGGSPGDQPATD